MESEDVLIAKGRMNGYLWLSNYFLTEPTLDFLKGIISEEVLLPLEGIFEAEGADSIRRLRDFMRHLDEAAAIRVRREYQRLFNLSVKSGYVPPYESCIRERKNPGPTGYGNFWGTSTNEVSNYYSSADFDPTVKEDILAPDHMGLELVFMSVLCSREAEALKKGDHKEVAKLRDLEFKFLNEHLSRWVGGYVNDLKAKSGGFYSNIASLTKIFVQSDVEMLSG